MFDNILKLKYWVTQRLPQISTKILRIPYIFAVTSGSPIIIALFCPRKIYAKYGTFTDPGPRSVKRGRQYTPPPFFSPIHRSKSVNIPFYHFYLKDPDFCPRCARFQLLSYRLLLGDPEVTANQY